MFTFPTLEPYNIAVCSSVTHSTCSYEKAMLIFALQQHHIAISPIINQEFNLLSECEVEKYFNGLEGHLI